MVQTRLNLEAPVLMQPTRVKRTAGFGYHTLMNTEMGLKCFLHATQTTGLDGLACSGLLTCRIIHRYCDLFLLPFGLLT